MSVKSQFDLNQFLATRTETVNAALDKFLPSEKTKPATGVRQVHAQVDLDLAKFTKMFTELMSGPDF